MCNILSGQLGAEEINGQAVSILYSFRWLHPERLVLAHTNVTAFSTETTTYLKTDAGTAFHEAVWSNHINDGRNLDISIR